MMCVSLSVSDERNIYKIIESKMRFFLEDLNKVVYYNIFKACND